MEAATAVPAVAEERRTVSARRPTEEEIWDALVSFTAKHGVELKRRLKYAVGDDAEDVYQDTLISVMKALPAAALDPGQLPSYIYRAAYRTASRRAQRNGRSVPIEAFGDEELPAKELEGSEERADQYDRMAQFGEAIEKLPVKERRALLMRSAGQMRVKDVAEVLGEDYRHTRYLIDHASKSVETHLQLIGEGQLCDEYRPIIRQSVFGELQLSERMRLKVHLSYCPSCRKARVQMLDVSRTAKMMLPPVLFLPFADQLQHIGLLHGLFDPVTVLFSNLGHKVSNFFTSLSTGGSDAAGAATQSVIVVVVAATATAGATSVKEFDIGNIDESFKSTVSAVSKSVEDVSQPRPSSPVPVSAPAAASKSEKSKDKGGEGGKSTSPAKKQGAKVEKASTKTKKQTAKKKSKKKSSSSKSSTPATAAVPSPTPAPQPSSSVTSSGDSTSSGSVTEGGAEEFGP